MDRNEELRRAINSLSSRICRAKKAGEDTTALEAQRSALQAEKKSGRRTMVTAAPRPKGTKKSTRQVKISTVPNKVGAMMDATAIQEAVTELGITRPVQVKWSTGRSRIGCTRLKGHKLLGNDHIVITVSNQIVKPERTSETIWHELTHAKQMEGYDDGYAFAMEYKRHGYTGNAYRRNPYEVEARVTADEKVNDGKLLVKGADQDKVDAYLMAGGSWADRKDIDPQTGFERRTTRDERDEFLTTLRLRLDG